MDAEEPVRIPITGEFDLHSFAPRDVKAAVEAYLEEASAIGLKALRIVHGKGIGKSSGPSCRVRPWWPDSGTHRKKPEVGARPSST
jgi:DNA-nicking Smr family endonuclease